MSLAAERVIKAELGVSNQNPVAVVSEAFVKGLLEQRSGHQFQLLGSNTKGFDLQDVVTGETYEVKSTNTAESHYHYGNLVGKSADWCVFIKWNYNLDYVAEYCLLFRTGIILDNLQGNNNRLQSTRLDQIRESATDLTGELQAFMELAR